MSQGGNAQLPTRGIISVFRSKFTSNLAALLQQLHAPVAHANSLRRLPHEAIPVPHARGIWVGVVGSFERTSLALLTDGEVAVTAPELIKSNPSRDSSTIVGLHRRIAIAVSNAIHANYCVSSDGEMRVALRGPRYSRVPPADAKCGSMGYDQIYVYNLLSISHLGYHNLRRAI